MTRRATRGRRADGVFTMDGSPTFDLLWLIPLAAGSWQLYRAARYARLRSIRRTPRN